MGLDESEKVLADYNEVFADIINGFLFGGRQVILPENLENSGNRSQYKAKGKLHQQERDVSKYYRNKEVRVAFLTPEQVKMFRSDFRLVADFFVQKRLKGEYIPPDIPIQHVDEFLKLLEVLVGEKRYEEILKEMQVNGYYKDGETTMCEIYDQIYNKGVAAERVKTDAERKKRLKERNRANRLAVENKNQKEEIRRLRKLLAEKT